MIQKETLFQAPSNPIWGLAGANSTNKFRSFYRCETTRCLPVSKSISRNGSAVQHFFMLKQLCGPPY